MDSVERRRDLALTENPNRRLDYIITLEGSLEGEPPLTVQLRYVPDRNILNSASFGRYLSTLSKGKWDSREQIAASILDDINNEVVARWVQVLLSGSDALVSSHRVLMEDRQPKWDNPDLLSRLRRI